MLQLRNFSFLAETLRIEGILEAAAMYVGCSRVFVLTENVFPAKVIND